MFESKLNIFTIQKSADRNIFWLPAENVWKIGSNWGLKYQLKALLCIFQRSNRTYVTITWKPLPVTFYWCYICWYSSKFDYSMGRNCEIPSISPSLKKSEHILPSNQKSMYYVHITHYFYSKWVYFRSTIVLEHVWIKTKHIYHTNRLREN